MGQTSSLSLIRPNESEIDIVNQFSFLKDVDFTEVDQEGRSALHIAASQGMPQWIPISAFHLYVLLDKSHVCQVLIDTYGLDVHAVDQYGNTALHSAVYWCVIFDFSLTSFLTLHRIVVELKQ